MIMQERQAVSSADSAKGARASDSRPTRVDMTGRLLVVDDEEVVRRALRRSLAAVGHTVRTASSPEEALEALERDSFDVVLTDVHMPTGTALDILKRVRARTPDVPVVFLTGRPSVDTAARALEHGAFRYLVKPVPTAALIEVVGEALRARSLARAADSMSERAELDRAFHGALETLWIAMQPIVSVEHRETVAYEALMRSKEPALPHPGAVLAAAEKLGRVHLLGRSIRARVARIIDQAEPGPMFYVNVHPADLADAEIFDPNAPLSIHARRVVLELTERASLEGIPELESRLASLRDLGFRIAVDDLGAGYAGLSYFASVRPDLIKIDMSLVRGIDRDPVKQRVVLALAGLGRSLGIEVVGEGVETKEERDALVELRCTHLQGYLFARPGPPFPTARWWDSTEATDGHE